MSLEALAGGGVVAAIAAVSLGAFKVIKYVVARNGKKTSTPPAPARDCGPCNEQLKEMAIAHFTLGETLKENTLALKETTGEIREMVLMFRENMAEEKGRRGALRDTGRFPIQKE